MDIVLTLSDDEAAALTIEFAPAVALGAALQAGNDGSFEGQLLAKDADVRTFEQRVVDLVRQQILAPAVRRQAVYAQAARVEQLVEAPADVLTAIDATLESSRKDGGGVRLPPQ